MTPPFEITPLIGWSAAAVLGLGALATAIAAIMRVARTFTRWARVWDRFFREWFGEPEDAQRGEPRKPGIPERLGHVELSVRSVDEHVRQVDERVQQIDHEMHPNSGASLRDAVDDIRNQTRRPQAPSVHQTFVAQGDTASDSHHSEE